MTAVYRVYVAGSRREADRARQVMTDLQSAGCVITCDWTAAPKNDAMVDEATRFIASRECMDGVTVADCVLWLVPPPNHLSYGSPADFGLAVGMGKLTIASGAIDCAAATYWAHARVYTDAQAIEWVLKQRVTRERASAGEMRRVER